MPLDVRVGQFRSFAPKILRATFAEESMSNSSQLPANRGFDIFRGNDQLDVASASACAACRLLNLFADGGEIACQFFAQRRHLCYGSISSNISDSPASAKNRANRNSLARFCPKTLRVASRASDR